MKNAYYLLRPTTGYDDIEQFPIRVRDGKLEDLSGRLSNLTPTTRKGNRHYFIINTSSDLRGAAGMDGNVIGLVAEKSCITIYRQGGGDMCIEPVSRTEALRIARHIEGLRGLSTSKKASLRR